MNKIKKFLLLDTHTHIYPAYDLQLVFSCAIKNLKSLISSFTYPACRHKIEDDNLRIGLILTERSSENYFQELQNAQLTHSLTSRQLDPHCIEITSSGESVLVFAARQIKCREGLEIHVLGTNDSFLDNEPFIETLISLKRSGHTPVIPWGFGKWLATRGQLVKQAEKDLAPVFADSLLRPAWWPCPRLDSNQLPVLRGSDPLPWSGEEKIIGSYASLIPINSENNSVSAALLEAISSQNIEINQIIQAGERSYFRDTVRALKAL